MGGGSRGGERLRKLGAPARGNLHRKLQGVETKSPTIEGGKVRKKKKGGNCKSQKKDQARKRGRLGMENLIGEHPGAQVKRGKGERKKKERKDDIARGDIEEKRMTDSKIRQETTNRESK